MYPAIAVYKNNVDIYLRCIYHDRHILSQCIELQSRDIEFIEEIKEVLALQDSTVLPSVIYLFLWQAESFQKYCRICWS